jgi:site-specific recombinase XerC
VAAASKPPKGIRRLPNGRWRVYGRVHGEYFSKTFPFETALTVRKTWRHDERTKIRARQLGRAADEAELPPSGTIAADVAEYLTLVREMPSIEQRTYDLQCWVAALGADRRRRSVPARELVTVMNDWKASGLAAGTCNRRRTALMHLWHRLDGKSATNPLRDVPRFKEPGALPRGRPYRVLERIFKAMVPSPSRARLKAIAYIGIAHIELKRVNRTQDWNRKAGTLVIRGRAKGESAETVMRVIKLTQKGTAALREMDRQHAWGPFSNSTLGRRWHAAIARVRLERPDVPEIRPYDLRHSLGTEIFRLTRDLKSVKEYLGHKSLKTSERYMHAAVAEGVARAAAAFNEAHRRRRRRRPIDSR